MVDWHEREFFIFIFVFEILTSLNISAFPPCLATDIHIALRRVRIVR